MPSTHDLKQDETILNLSRIIKAQARKITALSKRITVLEENFAPTPKAAPKGARKRK